MKNILRTYLMFLTILCSLFVKNVNAQVSWSQVDGPYGGTIHDIHVTSNGYIFISTNIGLYRSTNGGQNWQLKDNGTYSSSITVIAGNLNDELYVGTLGGYIFRSSNYGASWMLVNQGMTSSNISALNIAQNNFIYTTDGGMPGNVFLSEDNGNSWQIIAANLAFHLIDIVINDSNYVYVISGTNGVFRTKNYGQSWETINDSLENDNISAIANMEDGLILLGVGKDLYVSENYGDYWDKRVDNLSNGLISTIYVKSPDQIYLGTLEGEVFFSEDSGYTWRQLNENFNIEEITSLTSRIDGAVLVGTSPTGVLLTLDNGITWEYINQGLSNFFCTSLLVDSLNRIYFGAYEGIFRSDSFGTNWVAINSGLNQGMIGYEVIALGQPITGKVYAASHEGVYLFNEQNNDWELLSLLECSSMLISDSSYIFVGTYLSGIFRSIDGGDNWENVYTHSGTNITDIGDFAENSLGDLFAGSDQGILKSIDLGQTWELINTAVIATGYQSLSCSSNDILYAGVYGQGVYRSEDFGYTWSQINDGFSNTNITSLISNSDGQTFLGIWGYNAGVFQISDDLNSWTKINTGLFNTNVNTLTLDNDEFLYAGTRDGFLFKSNETTTSIEPVSSLNPKKYRLEQNYPNPFNSTTEISYTLIESGFVTLKIYNVLGEEIKILISKEQGIGDYTISFDGSELTSGIYFYELIANDFVNTKKLLLIK